MKDKPSALAPDDRSPRDPEMGATHRENPVQREPSEPASIPPRSRWRVSAWIIYGIGLLLLMGTVEYGDLQINSFVANAVALGHWNVYQFFSSTPSLRAIATVMPPGYYVLVGLYLSVLHLMQSDPVPVHASSMFLHIFGAVRGWRVFWGLILLKVPNVIAMGVGAWSLGRIAKRFGLPSYTVKTLWLVSPILLTTSFMQSQMDIMPATLTVLALMLLDAENPTLTFVILGVAASIQVYPLLFAPPMAFLLARGHFSRVIKWGVAATLPFLLALVPFTGKPLIARVFLARDGASLFNSVRLGIVPIHLWFVVYAVICYTAWRMSPRYASFRGVLWVWLTVSASILVFSYWLPQWVVWMVPMAVLFATMDKRFLWLWIAVNGLFVCNNVFAFPRNLDGQLLSLVSGHSVLWTYPQLTGTHGPVVIYMLLIVGIGALVYRAFLLLEDPTPAPPAPSLLGLWYSLPLVLYVLALAAQQVIPGS